MKLFRTKNAVKTNARSGNPSKSLNSCDTFAPTFLQSAEDPSYAFARHVRSDPRSARRKIGSGTCPAKFARAFLRMCARGEKRSGERFLTGRTRRRRSQGLSRNEKTRSTNFLDALGWSIDIDFEWAGTRNFTEARPASEKRSGGRKDVRIHDSS